MAADLGKRLLAEVEEVGLDEILQTLRFRHDSEPSHFGIPALDKIINAAILDKSNPPASPPILEFTSQGPGSGTTHLLYPITTAAILPRSLGGNDSCVAILDTDNTFSVNRLVQQLRLALPPDAPPSSIKTALTHVHIFRPQSLTSLNATLESLPDYFLKTSHQSIHRPLAFIALDSLTAFHWQSKAAEEDRVFAHQHPSEKQSEQPPANNDDAHAQPQTDLSTLLKTTAIHLNTPIILTSHSLANVNNTPRFPLTTVRLTAHRRAVRNFPPTISVAEALHEAKDRQQAVEASTWEARVTDSGSTRGMGFEFKITNEGKEKIESALSNATAQLEIEDASSDNLKKKQKQLALKCVVTKAGFVHR